MALNKFQRMARTLPSLYRPEVNIMIGGLLKAWGIVDDEIEVQIQEAKNSIFVETSQGRFLDLLGNNVGVSRTPQLGIGDNDFRTLVPVMSFKPKQVRKTIIDLLDVFWGESFSRANLSSGNTETFNFGPATVLTGTANFIKDKKVVKGTGTLFLSEVQVGDYIKPTASSGIVYAKVSNVIDDETLELSLPWDHDIVLGATVASGPIRTLTYKVDNLVTKTIRFTPDAFEDLTAVKVSELVSFINANIEHSRYISASEFLDPVLGSKLNLRTNTPGVQGSIQVLGGDANDPSRLNFSLEVANDIRVGVFEVNPNEVVIQIPSSVPVLRRSLKGSVHPKQNKAEIFSETEVYDFSSLGASSTLNITIDSNPYVVTFTHASDFEDPANVTAVEVASVINEQLLFLEAFAGVGDLPKKVGLRTTAGSVEYQVTGGTANTLLQFDTSVQTDPDLIVSNYPASYIFDPNGQLFTVTGITTTLSAQVVAGTISSTIALTNAASFPNQPGKFILDFGRANQEGPISYNSRPNNSTLLIDASYIFQYDHASGRSINFVVDQPTIPRVTGDDYAVYIVGTEEARSAAQDLIRKLLAAGIVVRFIISFPEVLFECVCRDCGIPDDPSIRGSLTGSGPLVF